MSHAPRTFDLVNNSRDAKRFSKALSWVLRHGAVKLSLDLRADGYVPVSQVLASESIAKFAATVEDLRHAVESNAKQRFSLLDEEGVLYVRANQGHSEEVARVVKSEALLDEITDPSTVSACVHGTTLDVLAPIAAGGLNRMARQHVHFTAHDFGSEEIISGMRNTSNVLVHVDVAAAMAAGMRFFRSANDVILTEGFEGVVPPKFFAKIERVLPGGERVDVTQTALKLPEFLLVLDFEATCDRGKWPVQEIIEFPVVAVRVDHAAKTAEIVSTFHYYVKPVARPQLTEFCTELTGITQETVDAGLPFPQVLRLYHQFLVELGVIDETGTALTSFTHVTCGDWDLNKMLPAQLGHSQLKCPHYLRSWTNIKHAYAELYNRKARGMTDMLADLDLELQGRHHSGIDDVRNIVRIAQRLIADGATFRTTKFHADSKRHRRGKQGGGGGGRKNNGGNKNSAWKEANKAKKAKKRERREKRQNRQS